MGALRSRLSIRVSGVGEVVGVEIVAMEIFMIVVMECCHGDFHGDCYHRDSFHENYHRAFTLLP